MDAIRFDAADTARAITGARVEPSSAVDPIEPAVPASLDRDKDDRAAFALQRSVLRDAESQFGAIEQAGLNARQLATVTDRTGKLLDVVADAVRGERRVAGSIRDGKEVEAGSVDEAVNSASSDRREANQRLERARELLGDGTPYFGGVLPEDWPAELGELAIEDGELTYTDGATGIGVGVPADSPAAGDLLGWAAQEMRGVSALASRLQTSADVAGQIAIENMRASGTTEPGTKRPEDPSGIRSQLVDRPTDAVNALAPTRSEYVLDLLG